MVKKYWVYKYTSPSKREYIGITTNLKHRHSCHMSEKESAMYSVFKRYGEDNIRKTLLFVAFDKESAKEMEVFFIEKYNTYHRGYNRTLGGDKLIHNRKLTEEEVLEIVKHFKEGTKSYRMIGDIYKVSETTIRNISAGRSWLHITKGKVPKKKHQVKGEKQGNSKLTEEQVIKIKHRLNNLDKLQDIADEFNIAYSTVKTIYHGSNWKGVGPDLIKRPKNKLSQKSIDDVISLLEKGERNIDIIKETGLSSSSVKKIKRMWKERGARTAPL